jgi:hypothetical protein
MKFKTSLLPLVAALLTIFLLRANLVMLSSTRLMPYEYYSIPAVDDYLRTGPGTAGLLPACESLMQAPNSPVADGGFLSRDSTPVSWALRADGSRQLQLPLTCRLKRYTSLEARQCLKQKHVSFIGDSLSRYQFISLAHFIERGEYPARFGATSGPKQPCTHIDESGKPACSERPSVCMEGDFGMLTGDGWREFHSALGGSTDGGIFHGRLQCSCAKGNGIGANETTDNSFYVSDLGGVKISYISENGWGEDPGPIRGWKFTDCSEKGTCRRSATLDNDGLWARAQAHDWDWKDPLHEALLKGTLKSVLPDVDIVIYNRGLWGVLTKDRAEKIMPLLYDWTGENGRCFFRTTTASPDSDVYREPERTYVKRATFSAGCSTLDFAHLTREFESLPFAHPRPPKQQDGTIWNYRERDDVYWDYVHFLPWVYEELNNMLLNVLCNSKKYG